MEKEKLRKVEEALQILILSILSIVAVGSAGAIVMILADMFRSAIYLMYQRNIREISGKLYYYREIV